MTEEPIPAAGPASGEESVNVTETTPIERLISQTPETDGPNFPPYTDLTPRKKPGGFLFFAGVLLPSLVIIIELASGMCAEEFFDPLPTPWHTLIVCTVPLINLYLYLKLQRGDFEYRRLYGVMNGFVIVVAGAYSVLYLPLLPLAVFALVLLGMGILPMAPMFALIAAILYAKHLRRAMEEQRRILSILNESPPARLRGLGTGIACAILALTLAEGHRTITYIGMEMAASTDPQKSLQGIRLLRAFGNQQSMAAACRNRNRDFTALFGGFSLWSNPVSIPTAQTIFYRVTGKTFESVGRPNSVAAAPGAVTNRLDPDHTGELNLSWEQGGWMTENLALESSRMDGTLDPDAALGYMEWTMVFKNTAFSQQEAVSQIQLPPGGVVSRLTLWVNGEEREAAFAGRGKVQAAYDAVVRTRRDPVIVQSLGSDRINVRCFPVQPQGEMKIRLGITSPMQLERGDEVWMRLPHFIERNFIVKRNAEHSVWFESKQPLEASSHKLKPEHPSENLFAVRGSLPHKELAKEFPAVRAHRKSEFTEAWTRDPQSKTGELVVQHIHPKQAATPMRAVLVVDGSAEMAEFAAPIAETLTKLPESGEFAILAASDEVMEIGQMQQTSSANLHNAAKRLQEFKFTGGQDNWTALARGWDLASQKPDSVIVWVHGPQPMRLSGAEDLQQRWQRRPGGPQLIDLQTRKGANVVAENLSGIAAVKTVARMGNISQELERLFLRWRNGTQQLATTREKVSAKSFTPQSNAKETSSHLVRLWAFDEVARLTGMGGGDEHAIQVASTYQLVTPLTGAVVLETKEQYERAGLEPVKAGTVPTVPEPEEWLLMITVALILAWMLFQRRRQWQAS